MNVHWVRCEIVVTFELGAGGVSTNEWYHPLGDRIVRSN